MWQFPWVANMANGSRHAIVLVGQQQASARHRDFTGDNVTLAKW
ncbi:MULTISPECIES: hypothetical protein [Gibbsiella]|nr:hypothetical protein [Gibbsiella quercinecans]